MFKALAILGQNAHLLNPCAKKQQVAHKHPKLQNVQTPAGMGRGKRQQTPSPQQIVFSPRARERWRDFFGLVSMYAVRGGSSTTGPKIPKAFLCCMWHVAVVALTLGGRVLPAPWAPPQRAFQLQQAAPLVFVSYNRDISTSTRLCSRTGMQPLC